MAVEAYPLHWPQGRPRTGMNLRESSQFRTSFGKARDAVLRQIALLAGYGLSVAPILSTNQALRRDGIPYANQSQPDDPGVAVYFTYKKTQVCFACDRWRRIEDNMQAIAKTIDALRGVARWGTGDMMEAAFKGFVALPDQSSWAEVLGVTAHSPTVDVLTAYRAKRSTAHPDRGGSPHEFDRIEKAWNAFQQERWIT